MSLLVGQHEELNERMSLSEVLSGTTFISGNGRIYRLFGNEDETFSVPAIPPIPPILSVSKTSALSLEDALQQIESFASPSMSEQLKPENRSVRRVERVCSTADSPTIQLFHALSESAPPRLVKREWMPSSETFSATEIVGEVSKKLSKQKNEKRKLLRVVSDHVEEPFIVPFSKPPSWLEESSNESETKNITLKIVSEAVAPIRFPKIFWRFPHRRRNPLYRKPFVLPPVSVAETEKPTVINKPIPHRPMPTFHWSEQLNSLMQTADSQIQMLADHLVVQSNQEIKAICFKSVFPGDGCSTILLCAVRALTERHHRILLVDTHHQHLDIPKQLNVSRNQDAGNDVVELSDHLALWMWQESKTVEDNRATLAEMIAAHRKEYDLILLDGGSVTESPLTDFVGFWNQIEPDGIVLVTNTKRPAEMPVAHIARRLRQHHIHLIGITENYV